MSEREIPGKSGSSDSDSDEETSLKVLVVVCNAVVRDVLRKTVRGCEGWRGPVDVAVVVDVVGVGDQVV